MSYILRYIQKANEINKRVSTKHTKKEEDKVNEDKNILHDCRFRMILMRATSATTTTMMMVPSAVRWVRGQMEMVSLFSTDAKLLFFFFFEPTAQMCYRKEHQAAKGRRRSHVI